jgi:hypothetical protein
MVVVGVAVTFLGLAGFFDSRDPLAGLLLVLVVVPALPPVVLGALMFAGRRWAGSALRTYLLVLLGAGAWLHWGFGLNVFSPPSFGLTLAGAAVAWWTLSYLGDRRGA